MTLTTTQRGYGNPHQKTRRAWKPYVNRGEVDCTAAICLVELDTGSRRIIPDPTLQGDGWHLGHTDDRTGYDGPQHDLCNTSDGGRRSQARRARAARGPKRFDV